MITSKLPRVGTTIFTQMSALAEEQGAINLSQGFPDFDAPTRLSDALGRHASEGHNQYAPMTGLPELRQQISLQIKRYRGVECDPDTEITVVPGATEGIFCAVTACVHPGDEVIVFDPVYDSYGPAIELAGGRVIHVPLQGPDFKVDWSRVQAAISNKTRMVMINSPHNPCGAIFSDEDMRELERLAERHDLLINSDEVYEHLVYDNRSHLSVLQYPGLRARSFAHFSFGKTFSVTGWKTGYCVAPAALTRELRKVHQYVAFVAVTPVQWALADFLSEQPEYASTLSAFYQAKRDLFVQALAGSRFTFTPSAGSYFQLLDYSTIARESDTHICQHWTRKHKVASIPISVFYQQAPEQYFLRFCFAKRDEILLRAAEILCKI
ncbi:MAG: methionine aminotransferase [Alcanivorax sp.]|jgi:methionine aminotransferase